MIKSNESSNFHSYDESFLKGDFVYSHRIHFIYGFGCVCFLFPFYLLFLVDVSYFGYLKHLPVINIKVY